MADTTTVFLVYRKENAGIKNIYGAYGSRETAAEVIEEIVEEETSRFKDEEKRKKAAERVEKKLEKERLTVRSKPRY